MTWNDSCGTLLPNSPNAADEDKANSGQESNSEQHLRNILEQERIDNRQVTCATKAKKPSGHRLIADALQPNLQAQEAKNAELKATEEATANLEKVTVLLRASALAESPTHASTLPRLVCGEIHLVSFSALSCFQELHQCEKDLAAYISTTQKSMADRDAQTVELKKEHASSIERLEQKCAGMNIVIQTLEGTISKEVKSSSGSAMATKKKFQAEIGTMESEHESATHAMRRRHQAEVEQVQLAIIRSIYSNIRY